MYVNGNNDTNYLNILTNKLIEYGLLINKYRSEFIQNINKYITEIYSSIFKRWRIKNKICF